MIRRRVTLGTMLMLSTTLVLIGCGAGTGPSVEFKSATPQSQQNVSVEVSPIGEDIDPISAQLGFVQNGEAVAIRNGGRVPLSEDKTAEVFLAPYPPDWQTDLLLFLLNNEDYQPVTDVEVDLIYDMVFMDHGIDAQIGQKLGDGHYVLPLAFLMYGDWSVDVTVQLPKGKKHLLFIVKFFP